MNHFELSEKGFSMHPLNIKFMREHEEDGKLPYPDTCLQVNTVESIKTPTTTYNMKDQW